MPQYHEGRSARRLIWARASKRPVLQRSWWPRSPAAMIAVVSSVGTMRRVPGKRAPSLNWKVAKAIVSSPNHPGRRPPIGAAAPGVRPARAPATRPARTPAAGQRGEVRPQLAALRE